MNKRHEPDEPSVELIRELITQFSSDSRSTPAALAALVVEAYRKGWHQGWKDAPSDEF